MWWGIGGGLYFLFWISIMITLGITTLRKGHWVFFILGIFLPLFWLIGAVLPPKQAAQLA